MTLLNELSEHFGLGRPDLLRVIATAPARYKVYQIPKRHGGERTIAQPSAELKAIQRYIMETRLSQFPIHEAAMAYREGVGIADNASKHRNSDVVLKLDFENFFPSLLVRDWTKLLNRRPIPQIDPQDIPYLNRILFWGRERRSTVPRCLSIGAPTSPALSNILMYDIDCALVEQAVRLNVTYTRYADDITVSGEAVDVLLAFEVESRRIIRSSQSPRLVFNDDKRGIYRRGQRRMVTGLVITPDRNVSLGRDRKREISALLHRSTLGQLQAEQRAYLKGMLGFTNAVEPGFLTRLRTKYGNDAVDNAMSFRVPKRGDA